MSIAIASLTCDIIPRLVENDISNKLVLVMRLRDLPANALSGFLHPRGLAISPVEDHADIPGSYWGAPEAGLIGNRLYARPDTPVHSVLHTASHWICMEEERRAVAHTNAGGDDLEEAAVCYLQCLLADEVAGYSRGRVFVDMDAWGYSFRLGSARAWFENDADDARSWLSARALLPPWQKTYRSVRKPSFRLR